MGHLVGCSRPRAWDEALGDMEWLRQVGRTPTEKSEVNMIGPNMRRAFQAIAAFPLYWPSLVRKTISRAIWARREAALTRFMFSWTYPSAPPTQDATQRRADRAVVNFRVARHYMNRQFRRPHARVCARIRHYTSWTDRTPTRPRARCVSVCSTFVLLSTPFWRSLDSRHNSRQKVHFTYENRERRLTRSNQIKSVISEFW